MPEKTVKSEAKSQKVTYKNIALVLNWSSLIMSWKLVDNKVNYWVLK